MHIIISSSTILLLSSSLRYDLCAAHVRQMIYGNGVYGRRGMRTPTMESGKELPTGFLHDSEERGHRRTQPGGNQNSSTENENVMHVHTVHTVNVNSFYI